VCSVINDWKEGSAIPLVDLKTQEMWPASVILNCRDVGRGYGAS